MKETHATQTTITTHEISIEQGRLFAQSWDWQPSVGPARIPIILMHDSLGCVPLWRQFPENLLRLTGHPVIAYDRLGFGRSDPHPGVLSADFIAQEIEQIFPQVLDALQIGDFIACGHSVGGAMAVEAAARYADRCKALITMGAQVFVEEHTLNGIRQAKTDFADPENLSRLDKYHGQKSRWVVDAWTDTWLSQAFSTWHARDQLPGVQCPILAIHGDSDPYGSTEHARVIAGNTGTADILSGIGHVPYREDEQRTLNSIQTFLIRCGLAQAATQEQSYAEQR